MWVTRGWLPQRAGSPIPVGGGDAATVPPSNVTALCVRMHLTQYNAFQAITWLKPKKPRNNYNIAQAHV